MATTPTVFRLKRPNCPRQDNPPTETLPDLFRKTWWLFFKGLVDSINAIIDFLATLDVTSFGAIGDALRYDDGAITIATKVFTSADANFSQTDIGKSIAIVGAGAAGVTLVTTIAAFTNAHSILLGTAAGATVTGATFVYGTDNTAAFQSAVDAATAGRQRTIFIPRATGGYLTVGTLAIGTGRVTFQLGGATWYAAATLFTVTENTPAFPALTDGGCVSMIGDGVLTSQVQFILSTTNLVYLIQVNGAEFSQIGFECIARSTNTATCFNLSSCFNSRVSGQITGFYNGIDLNGRDDVDGLWRGSVTWIVDLLIRTFTGAGIRTSHAVETMISNVQLATAIDNPALAWGLIVDTDSSGLDINGLIMSWCGIIVRNTMSTVSIWGGPPSFIFGNNIVADSMTTPGFRFDTSLDPGGDASGRTGISYHFIDCWAAFTQTNGDDCIQVLGGGDISFTDVRIRVARRNGIYINGGNNIRIINPLIVASNFQNFTNGSGIYLESVTGNLGVQIEGGRIGDAIEASTFQYWGVYIKSGFSSPVQIIGVDLRNNVTGAISDNGAGLRQLLGNQMEPFGAGDTLGNVNILSLTKGRLEVGDGAFYMDYKESSGADNVGIFFDSQDSLRYYRTLNAWHWLIGNTSYLRFALSGTAKSVEVLNRPTDATGLTEPWLNSSLDADSAERWNVTGAGRITWGDGTTADVLMERTGSTRLYLSSDFKIAGLVGIGVDPETSWNLKTPVAKFTTGVRFAWITGGAAQPLKASTVGDVIAGAINLASEVTGVLPVANGGTGTSGSIAASSINWSGLTSGEALTPSGSGITTIAGVTTSGTFVTSVVPTFDTLQYKDWGGGNASEVVVIDVAVTDVSVGFTNGIWTS